MFLVSTHTHRLSPSDTINAFTSSKGLRARSNKPKLPRCACMRRRLLFFTVLDVNGCHVYDNLPIILSFEKSAAAIVVLIVPADRVARGPVLLAPSATGTWW